MEFAAMNRALFIASRWMKNLGLPGMAGVVMLVLAVAAYLGMTLPQYSRLNQLTQEVADAQAQQKSAGLNPVADTHSSVAHLRAFYEFFPVRQSAPQLIGTIYKAARAESITLSEGEYKYSLGKAGAMGMYQVDLPVKGSYVQIRKFIVKVLNAMPSAALEEVSFKRESVGSAELEARIRFTIYMSVA
jgi:Tfp pilus assembly protein PilO